ncbi:MAG: hypothetical protein RR365_00655 [Bacteroides sp.]
MTAWRGLQEKLAQYEGKAAVFYQNAPSDMANGWKNKVQYPRVDYTVDMHANPERQSSGQAIFNIWCIDTGTMPEKIEPDVRAALCGIFITPDGEPPYCLAWQRSDSFEAANETERAKQIVGITMAFDVFAFPNQITSDPDPIMAMNHFIKEWEPEVTVIGHDALQPYHEPQAETPAVYFRISSLETSTETNTVTWMNGVIAGHVFAPTAEARLRWLRYLVDTLAQQGEVTMLDTSPMTIRKLTADAGLDPLSQGQLRIQMRFGILRKAFVSPLMHISVQDEEADPNLKHQFIDTPVTIEAQPEDAGYKFNSKLAGKKKLP